MPVIRNPFKKTPAVVVDPKAVDNQSADASVPRSEDNKTPAISILAHRDDEPNTFKLSVVNGSGEYLPPSPTEKKGFWKRSNSSTSVRREAREALRAADNEEGFTISRESFDGYRRSFDISARSPVIDPQRPSLDSRRPSRSSFDRLDRLGSSRTSFDALTPTSPLRQSFDSRHSSSCRLPPPVVAEEDDGFKEVDLHDGKDANAHHHKKKGFLARFGGHGDHNSSDHPENYGKSRSRSSTLTWKKDMNKGSEELGDFQPDTQNAK